MATIQVVIDDELLEQLDSELHGARRARSAFVRKAIEEKLRRARRSRLEELDRLGYLEPPTKEEQEEAAAWTRLSARAWDDLPWESKGP